MNTKEGCTSSETEQTPREVVQQYQIEGSLSSGSDQQVSDFAIYQFLSVGSRGKPKFIQSGRQITNCSVIN